MGSESRAMIEGKATWGKTYGEKREALKSVAVNLQRARDGCFESASAWDRLMTMPENASNS